jgi:Mn-dependent DtxR family transcriptional regulator
VPAFCCWGRTIDTVDSAYIAVNRTGENRGHTVTADCQDPGMPPRVPWRIVYEALRARIESDEWEHDARLPTVRALAQQYGVSHQTVAKALRALAEDGLIETAPGFGVFRT